MQLWWKGYDTENPWETEAAQLPSTDLTLCRSKGLSLFIKFYSVRELMITVFILDSLTQQLGKNKVFLRAGQIAVLDSKRAEVLDKAAKLIQAHFRCFIAYRDFIALKRAAINLQCCFRGINLAFLICLCPSCIFFLDTSNLSIFYMLYSKFNFFFLFFPLLWPTFVFLSFAEIFRSW